MVRSDSLEGWGAEWSGREGQEGGDIYVYVYILMSDSCCCMAETNTML